MALWTVFFQALVMSVTYQGGNGGTVCSSQGCGGTLCAVNGGGGFFKLAHIFYKSNGGGGFFFGVIQYGLIVRVCFTYQ